MSKHATSLQADQKLDIAHRVIVGCETHADIALEYRVSRWVIQGIVKKVNKNPKYLSELITKQSAKALEEERFCEFIETHIAQGTQIRTVKHARDLFSEATSTILQLSQVK